jgi:hypothetical protein
MTASSAPTVELTAMNSAPAITGGSHTLPAVLETCGTVCSPAAETMTGSRVTGCRS